MDYKELKINDKQTLVTLIRNENEYYPDNLNHDIIEVLDDIEPEGQCLIITDGQDTLIIECWNSYCKDCMNECWQSFYTSHCEDAYKRSQKYNQ